MKISRRYEGCTDWRENKEWYCIDEERDRYVLTDKAPEMARKSFELYMRLNWKFYEDLGVKPLAEEILYEEATKWMANPDWYCIDEEYDQFALTDKAPEMARKSFELWEKINGVD